MPDTVLAKEVARVSKNNIIACLVALALATGAIAFNGQYLIKCTRGPALFNPDKMSTTKDLTDMAGAYLKVPADKIWNTGVEITERQYDKYSQKVLSETKLASIIIVESGKHALLVKTRDQKPQREYVGFLTSVPEDVFTALIGNKAAQDRDSKSRPMMLDTLDPLVNFYSLVTLLVLTIVIGLWFLWQALSARQSNENCALFKSIAKFGNLRELQMEIEQGFQDRDTRIGKVLISPSWLLVQNRFSTGVLRLADVAWSYAYKRSTTRNFMESTHHEVYVWLLNGSLVKIPSTAKDCPQVVRAIQQSAPWSMAGYDGAMMLRWSAHRQEILDEILRARTKLRR